MQSSAIPCVHCRCWQAVTAPDHFPPKSTHIIIIQSQCMCAHTCTLTHMHTHTHNLTEEITTNANRSPWRLGFVNLHWNFFSLKKILYENFHRHLKYIHKQEKEAISKDETMLTYFWFSHFYANTKNILAYLVYFIIISYLMGM
jgi:hypothetical protein